jgi:type VI secretion system protein ImpH
VALAVPGVGVRVDEFYPAHARAGKPQPLTAAGGTDSAKEGADEAGVRRGLGGGYVLGQRVVYRSRAVRVTLRPASGQQTHDLLPGAWLHRELMAFLRLYVGTKADVFLRMDMSSRLAPAPRIGAPHAAAAPRLGWTIVLPSADECLLTVPLGCYEAFPGPAPHPQAGAAHAV